MASFVSANLGSDSDSDDQDYDPTKDVTGEVVSEEDGSGDDEDGMGAKKKGRKTKKGSKRKQQDQPGRRGGGILFVEDDDEALKAEEERKKEFELEKVEKKEEDEKKKLDDLWADFKKDVKPVAAASKPKPVGSGLGSWSMVSKNSKVVKKVSSVPKKTSTDIFSSIFDNIGDDSKLSTKAETKPVEAPRSIISSIFEEKKNIPAKSATSEDESLSSSSQDKTSVTEDGSDDKVTITKVFDFAGESVEVRKEVSKDSKEAQKFLKETAPSSGNDTMPSSSGEGSAGAKRPGGLNSIMGIISGKKPKLGTLDKSKMDWNSFVEQEGIKEELQTHNKGKEGYVEKQMFLERADLRRFEIEKAAREKNSKNAQSIKVHIEKDAAASVLKKS